MPTDQLIDRLVGDLRPVRRRSLGVDALVLAALGLVEVILFLALGFMRPDMPVAVGLPAFWWKLASTGVVAAIGGGIALLSFDPAASPRQGLRWLMSAVALCLAAGWVIDASRQGWPGLLERLDWRGGVQCASEMGVLAVPAMIGMGLLMRRAAPTDMGATAWTVGITAAAWGAFVFVFACPNDDPLYIAVWYAVGCGLTTLVARLILPPLTRW